MIDRDPQPILSNAELTLREAKKDLIAARFIPEVEGLMLLKLTADYDLELNPRDQGARSTKIMAARRIGRLTTEAIAPVIEEELPLFARPAVYDQRYGEAPEDKQLDRFYNLREADLRTLVLVQYADLTDLMKQHITVLEEQLVDHCREYYAALIDTENGGGY